jgi:hypothetical protein
MRLVQRDEGSKRTDRDRRPRDRITDVVEHGEVRA